jgi:enolase
VKKASYKLGEQIFIALDVAASGFYDAKRTICLQEVRWLEAQCADLVADYQTLAKKFPIASIEDGCAENDWDGWKRLTDVMGDSLQLVGDDFLVTNVDFLRKAIASGVANSILVKVNQIGSLTKTLDAIELARSHAYTAAISHRSGESEDTTIADIAVATNAGQIKTGSLSRTDRVAKNN